MFSRLGLRPARRDCWCGMTKRQHGTGPYSMKVTIDGREAVDGSQMRSPTAGLRDDYQLSCNCDYGELLS